MFQETTYYKRRSEPIGKGDFKLPKFDLLRNKQFCYLENVQNQMIRIVYHYNLPKH